MGLAEVFVPLGASRTSQVSQIWSCMIRLIMSSVNQLYLASSPPFVFIKMQIVFCYPICKGPFADRVTEDSMGLIGMRFCQTYSSSASDVSLYWFDLDSKK